MKPAEKTKNASGPEGTQGGAAIVVHPVLKQGRANAPLRDPEARLAEACALTEAIGLKVSNAVLAPLSAVRPATYLGSGKVEELHKLADERKPDVVVFDGALSAAQQRNLEKEIGAKVIDRTGLILEIFGERARTREGALQVELAHLSYQRSRLVKSWTHLERQRGGFGFLGGPGETQIETDRRLIGERIAKIRRELEEVKRTRALHRKARHKVPFPVVALVGYTNAGKSTLFNRLTGAEVLAKDMLFATLDPTMRGIVLPGGRKIILSDTVGFISDLPTQLVAAFRATLEEVIEADLILHVRDIAHPDSDAQCEDVLRVLEEIGVSEGARERMIEVRNKIDLLPGDDRTAFLARNGAGAKGRPARIYASAVTGEGLDALQTLVEARIAAGAERMTLKIAPEDGAGLAWVYAHASVLARKQAKNGAITLEVEVPPSETGRFRERFRLSA